MYKCKQVTYWPSDLLSLLKGEQRMEPVLAPEDRFKQRPDPRDKVNPPVPP